MNTYETSKGQNTQVVISKTGTIPNNKRCTQSTTTCAIFIK